MEQGGVGPISGKRKGFDSEDGSEDGASPSKMITVEVCCSQEGGSNGNADSAMIEDNGRPSTSHQSQGQPVTSEDGMFHKTAVRRTDMGLAAQSETTDQSEAPSDQGSAETDEGVRTTGTEPAPVWGVDRRFTHSTPEAAKFFVTEDKVRRLMSRGKFIDAKSLLEADLPDDGRKIMPNQNLQKMLIECYLVTGSYTEASECLESLVTMMSSLPDQSNPEQLLKLVPTPHQPVQALILLPGISKQFLLRRQPNLAIDGIWRCSDVCDDAIKSMVEAGDRFRQIPADFAIGIQLDILEDFQSVSGGDQDERVVCESNIFNCIGSSYGRFDLQLESSRCYQRGFDLMSHHFGSKAAQYNIFSFLLSNLGLFHENLENYVEAEKYLSESMRTIELAEDITVEQKTSFITEKTEWLRDIRDELKSL